MVNIDSLWGDDFSIKNTKEADLELLEKTKKPLKVVSSEKSLKSKKTSIEDKLAIIREEVLRILGGYAENTVVIKTKQQLIDYIDKSIQNGIISVDTETNNSLDPITCKLMGPCIYTPGQKNAYIPINHINYITGERLDWQLTEEDVAEQFKRLENTPIIFHNGKFDYEVIKCTTGVPLKIYWDTMIGARMLNENERAGLKEQYITKIDPSIEKYDIEHLFSGIEYAVVDPEIFALYAATDAFMTYKLYEWQLKQFNLPDNKRIFDVFKNVEIPVITVAAQMELDGVEIDKEYATRLSEKYHKKSEELDKLIEIELKKYDSVIAQWRLTPDANYHPPKKAGSGEGKSKSEQLEDPVSISSPTQLAILIYDVLQYKSVDKKMPRGTGEDILVKLNEKYQIPLCDLILQKRGLEKLIGTYIDKLPACVSPKDGRLHAQFQQLGTDTGRFSSCIEGTQLVDVVGGKKPIKDIEPNDLVYCYDDSGNLKISKVLSVKNMGKKSCVDIKWQSSGTGLIGHLICTPDHLIRCESGEWIQAQQLNRYTKLAHLHRADNLHRIRFYGWNNYCKVEEQVIKEEYFQAPKNYHIHHIDFDKKHNEIFNLQVMSAQEHTKYHAMLTIRNDPEKFLRFKYSDHSHNGSKSGVESHNYWHVTREELEKLIIESKCKLRDVPHDFNTVKKKIVELGIDIEELKEKYFSEVICRNNYDIDKIAKELNTSQKYVKRYMNKYNTSKNHMVQSVTYCGEFDVYDIEVETYHNFIASEINVHNCNPNL